MDKIAGHFNYAYVVTAYPGLTGDYRAIRINLIQIHGGYIYRYHYSKFKHK